MDSHPQPSPASGPPVLIDRYLSRALLLVVLGCCAVATVIVASGVATKNGIDVSEDTQNPSITKLVPLDAESVTKVTVQVSGTASPLTGIYVQNLAGALLPALSLTILDTTTGLTVYTGPLSGLSSSPESPQRICAIGSTDTDAGCIQTWPADELHRFTITASFPSHGLADNAYQGAGGSLSFVWGRS